MSNNKDKSQDINLEEEKKAIALEKNKLEKAQKKLQDDIDKAEKILEEDEELSTKEQIDAYKNKVKENNKEIEKIDWNKTGISTFQGIKVGKKFKKKK